jgi:hypothetical protein
VALLGCGCPASPPAAEGDGAPEAPGDAGEPTGQADARAPETAPEAVSTEVRDTAPDLDATALPEATPVPDLGPPVPTGETCEDAIPILGLPFNDKHSTGFAADDYALAGGCSTGGSIGAGARDVVYRFTPEVSGHHAIALTPISFDGKAPSAVYVTTECGTIPAECVAVSGDLTQGGVFTALLEAGLTYYLIIDGLLATAQGGFSLDVFESVCVPTCAGDACGKDGCGGFCGEGCGLFDACAPNGTCVDPEELEGDTCALARVIDKLPFAQTQDTYYGFDDYAFGAGACPGEPHPGGWGSNDHAWAFTPENSGLYEITLAAEFDTVIYLVTECEDVSGTCVAGGDASLGIEQIQVNLVGGTTYTILVDGYGDDLTTNLNGVYTLIVANPCVADCQGDAPPETLKLCGDDGCGASCGSCAAGEACSDAGQCGPAPPGDHCSNPIQATGVPFTYTGDTTGMSPDSSYGKGECPGVEAFGWGLGSNDMVFAFTPPASQAYEIRLDSSFDGTLYVATDCTDLGGSCVGAVEANVYQEVMVLDLSAGTPYFVVVDGFGNLSAQAGTFTLSVGIPCAPTCQGAAPLGPSAECGPDGCGGSCGECEPAQICDPAGQCVEIPGNSCATPFWVTELPFQATGDTSDATSAIGLPYDACPGETDVLGVESKDEVYAFTPTEAGVYTIGLTASFPAALFVVNECKTFAAPDCFVLSYLDLIPWYDTAGTCFSEYLGLCEGIASSPFLTSDLELAVRLDAGTPYRIIVDGVASFGSDQGTYALTLDGPCKPACQGAAPLGPSAECGTDGCGLSCGTCPLGQVCDAAQQCVDLEGNTCETAFVIDEVPFFYEGSTKDATNVYALPGDTCKGQEYIEGAASNDEVFAFTPTEGGAFEVTLDAGFDANLVVLTDCAETLSSCFFKETYAVYTWMEPTGDCAPGAGACLGFLPYDATDEKLKVVLPGDGSTYYFVVDGIGNLWNTKGKYALTLDQACIPKCEGKTCGDDGCGKPCGTCPDGWDCTPEGQCLDASPNPGDTCENPWEVTPVEPDANGVIFLGAGDTSQQADGYGFDGCSGLFEVTGTGSKDEVWRFVPPKSAPYVISVQPEPGFEPILYVLASCTEDVQECLAGTEIWVLSPPLEAGKTYFIVVDGKQAGAQGSYFIEIKEP